MADQSNRRTEPCDECGKLHPNCVAHNRSGQPCGMRPQQGLFVCRLHGGAAPQVKARLRRNEVKRDAIAYLASLDITPDQYADPHAAILEELTTACREVEFYAEYLKQLSVPTIGEPPGEFDNVLGVGPDGALVLGAVAPPIYGPRYTFVAGRRDAGGDHSNEQIEHVILTQWTRARERKAKLAKAVIELGIAERQQRLNEQVAQTFVSAVMAIANDEALALTVDQLAAFRVAAATQLRRVALEERPPPQELISA